MVFLIVMKICAGNGTYSLWFQQIQVGVDKFVRISLLWLDLSNLSGFHFSCWIYQTLVDLSYTAGFIKLDSIYFDQVVLLSCMDLLNLGIYQICVDFINPGESLGLI